MKPVLVSQRVDVYPDRSERRDALDQKLAEFLASCGLLAVPVPNHAALVADISALAKPVGIVLTGGNDLAALGGNAPERDATEDALVAQAAASAIPVIGICRGMQFLAHRSGGTLARVDGHVARRHAISGLLSREVNSFHSWGIVSCGDGWKTLANAADGTIECAENPDRLWRAMMWHPEREPCFTDGDRHFFVETFSGFIR